MGMYRGHGSSLVAFASANRRASSYLCTEAFKRVPPRGTPLSSGANGAGGAKGSGSTRVCRLQLERGVLSLWGQMPIPAYTLIFHNAQTSRSFKAVPVFTNEFCLLFDEQSWKFCRGCMITSTNASPINE
jgi:hypothetical protein